MIHTAVSPQIEHRPSVLHRSTPTNRNRASRRLLRFHPFPGCLPPPYPPQGGRREPAEIPAARGAPRRGGLPAQLLAFALLSHERCSFQPRWSRDSAECPSGGDGRCRLRRGRVGGPLAGKQL